MFFAVNPTVWALGKVDKEIKSLSFFRFLVFARKDKFLNVTMPNNFYDKNDKTNILKKND